MEEINKYTINVEEDQLNSLFKEILDGVRDDINEAQENVDLLHEKINDKTLAASFELYEAWYNDALKVKGSARDRQLKFLNLFKDRVSTKERIHIDEKSKQGELGNIPSAEELNLALRDIIETKKKQEQNAIVKMKKEETSEDEIEGVNDQIEYDEDDFVGNFDEDNDE